MPRFIDRLLSEGLSWPQNGYDLQDPDIARATSQFGPGIINRINNSQRVVIDDVAEYFFSINSKEEFSVLKDFPNLAPPMPDLWLEYKSPSSIYSEAKGHTPVPRTMEYCGALLCYEKNSPAGWGLAITSFMGMRNGMNLLNNPITMLRIDSQGAPVPMREGIVHNAFFGMRRELVDSLPEEFREISPLVFAPLTAVCFMHCKGTRLDHPPPVPLKLAKAYERRHHGTPLARYKVLNVDPVKRILDTVGNVRENGLARALHICRGHFSTYTPDAPLFGKHVGTYFIPDHLRGSEKAGTVDKTYNVKAPPD